VVSVLVCAPVFVAGGLAFGWFVKGTADASGGAKSPAAAVQAVFGATTHWAGEDVSEVLPYLCPEQSEDLRNRIKKLRADLATLPGTELTPHDFTTTPSDRKATVSVMVAVTATDRSDGQTQSFRGADHEWRFDTVDAGSGWKVCGWEAPELCGADLYC
jgi:hypothetical protein